MFWWNVSRGFASVVEWQRAYLTKSTVSRKTLVDSQTVIVKIFAISKDEQEIRFKDREQKPISVSDYWKKIGVIVINGMII